MALTIPTAARSSLKKIAIKTDVATKNTDKSYPEQALISISICRYAKKMTPI